MVPYRVRQVWNLLHQAPTNEDVAWVRQRLSRSEQALFFAQQPADQAHAVQVARALVQRGLDDPFLLTAALLHDVGKSPGISLPYRVAVVFLKRVAPQWLAAINPTAGGCLAPLARAVHHPALGAALARVAGCPPEVVTLIDYHQSRNAPLEMELRDMLAALQAVDDVT